MEMIFCVEDDIGIRELMLYTLRASGYEAEGFEDAESFWAAMNEAVPDLVMLDVMLPDEDGISILKKIRDDAATSQIPVIMASAKGTEYDKVLGLDLGADDYLAKPFGMMEMVSHVRAVLRRSGKPDGAAGEILRYADIEMNEKNHTVRAAGNDTELTYKEYELLKKFLKNPGRVFSRDALLSSVWGSDYAGETRTVDVHVGSLRSKLGSAGSAIKTVRGVGYKLEE